MRRRREETLIDLTPLSSHFVTLVPIYRTVGMAALRLGVTRCREIRQVREVRQGQTGELRWSGGAPGAAQTPVKGCEKKAVPVTLAESAGC